MVQVKGPYLSVGLSFHHFSINHDPPEFIPKLPGFEIGGDLQYCVKPLQLLGLVVSDRGSRGLALLAWGSSHVLDEVDGCAMGV